MRIALVGYDACGAAVADALAPSGALLIIADPDPAHLARARQAHPQVHVTGRIDAVLEPAAVDFVLAQGSAHLDVVQQAVALGIGVVMLPAGGDDPTVPLRQLLGIHLTAPRQAGISPDAFLHPTVDIAGAVEVGAGTRIWHFSKLLGPLTIGEKCSLGQNVVVERNVSIGNNVKIQNNVSVYSGVILEDDVFCGPSMVFTNVGTPRSAYPRRGQYATTRLEKGASVGANATIVCGHTLGRYAFVGAGAVVTRDVPAYALVYGNPARLRGWACYCGARLKMGITIDGAERCQCDECGRMYRRNGHRVEEESA
jgi:UDP-2-acetamido-3-amino-2,3-dideoxy-glucuronate N-acetyltransferase